MTNNQKIAIWLGWEKEVSDTLKTWRSWIAPDGTRHDCPPAYCTNDIVAFELMQTLAKLGYLVQLKNVNYNWYFSVNENIETKCSTIAAAISNAILILIEEQTNKVNIKNEYLIDLIQHMQIHAGYPKCGYMQMTTKQKLLFNSILTIKSE